MLNEQAERELNKIVTSAYEEGFKAGQKSARAERTKELNALDKKLEGVEKQIDDYADELHGLAESIRELAGKNATFRHYD